MLELICIGDELLDGRTRDLNAFWLGEVLSRRGLVLSRVTFVSDDVASIVSALDVAAGRARYVLVSGGLGPTLDDRSREAAALWVDTALVEDEAVLDQLIARFAERAVPFSPTNRQQALFPEGSDVLPTEVGTASGFRLRRGESVADFVPGVPGEFRWFVRTHWLPLVAGESRGHVFERRWRFFGLGESQLAHELSALDSRGASLHYTARFPEVHLFARLVSRGETDDSTVLAALDEAIRDRVGHRLIGVGEQTLAERVGEALRARGWRLATAESCTGGQIGQTITSAAGSSDYYVEGFVTYSNEAKMARLDVTSETLEHSGAVSAETALEMARGAKALTGAEIAIAVTGIAGPSGGTAEKPVGTVHVALSTPDGDRHLKLGLLGRDREQIRTWTTWAALTGVLWYLEKRLPDDWEERS